MPESLSNFAFVLITASVFGMALRLLGQPLIISYFLTGLLVSFLSYVGILTLSGFGFLPEVGVAFLLFLVGMELDFRELRRIGRTVLSGAVFYVFTLFLLGVFLGRLFSFTSGEAVFLGITVSFSSTVLVMKFLSDKRETSSLHGKISIGILLIEDLLALLVLFFIGFFTSGALFGAEEILQLLTKLSSLLTLYVLAVFFSKDILPAVFSRISDNGELLLLASISLCLFFTVLSSLLGVSVSIGAFLAGFALAGESMKFFISSRVRPLRDLFVALFFIDAASRVSFDLLPLVVIPLVVLLFFVLAVKPYVIYLALAFARERRRVCFLSSFSMGQVSEFSLIILAQAFFLGMVSQKFYSLIILLFVLSAVLSSLFSARIKEIFRAVERLPIFLERERLAEFPSFRRVLSGHVVLIGCDRVGEVLLRFLKKSAEKFVVLDFNPDVISKLSKEEVPCVFGDMEDMETLEKLGITSSKMIISTVPSVFPNLELLAYLSRVNCLAPVFMVSNFAADAARLYDGGATYVAIPETLGGEHLASLLEKFVVGKLDREKMEKYQGEET